MNDTQQQTELQEAVRDTRGTSLAAYRTAQDDAVARHSDAGAKIEEADTTIHGIEREIHQKQMELARWQNFRAHQVKRREALERRIISGRAFIRAIEDEETGV